MKKFLNAALVCACVATLGAAEYRTVKVQMNSIPVMRELVGTVYSPSETMVATRLMGYLRQIAVDEGEVVRKGQLLFEVDPSDIASAQQQARAGMMMAENAYSDAKRDYERFQDLAKKGAVTERDLEKMELNLKTRKDALDMAKAGYDQAMSQSQYSKVYSPINGVVVRKMANIAEMAIPGKPVVVLSTLNNLRVQAMMQETDVGSIRQGDSAQVEIPSAGKSTVGRILSIVPAADMATHTVMVKISLNDNSGLLPGMYAKVKLIKAHSEGVMVPLATLTKRGGIQGVFAVLGGKAKFYPVKVLSYRADGAQVLGVPAGADLIVYPRENLSDGKPLS